MDYVTVTLGRSGLHVSRACLGATNFGSGPAVRCPELEARRIIDAFLDAGGNLIDTADVYGAGQSEEVVGRAIAAKRDSVVLATKGSGPLGEGPNDRGLSRVHLTRALDASLKRLGTEHRRGSRAVSLLTAIGRDPRRVSSREAGRVDAAAVVVAGRKGERAVVHTAQETKEPGVPATRDRLTCFAREGEGRRALKEPLRLGERDSDGQHQDCDAGRQ